jgi:TolB-like protein/Tfp pilus assembly protein PilF
MTATARAQTPPTPRAEDRLDSWKEIAAYLRRGVRTVRRWEKEEGLPVHRHLHQRLGTVYAYKPEIDRWWDARRVHLEHEKDDSKETRRRTWLAPALGAAATVILIALAWPSRTSLPPAAPPGRIMIAVLPFENLSGSPDQEFFSDGLTEEMITELGRLHPERLGVIARTSTMPYKRAKKPVNQIAAELGVDYLLEGSVRREGDRVRITTQLIRAKDQTHLWAENYDRDLAGVLDLQSQVSRAVANRIQLALAPDARAASASARPLHPQAHEAALMGRYFLERRTAESIGKARDAYEQAVRLDPAYALAYVGLADAHILSVTYADAPASDAMTRARAAVSKALELNPDLAEAHAWLGVILAEHDWDWTAAEREFRRAVDLDPNFAYAHKLYGEYLSYVGRFDQAIAEARLARQLDPLSIVTNSLLGFVLYRARQYDQAVAELNRAIELDPNHPMPYLPKGLAYSMKGMPDEALAALREGHALTPGSSEMVAQVAYAAARAGRREEARTLLNQLVERSRKQHVSPFFFAVVHTGLGESAAAIDSLERAYAERDWLVSVLKTDPMFDPLRGDARFQDLLRRINFPT